MRPNAATISLERGTRQRCSIRGALSSQGTPRSALQPSGPTAAH